jgi:hypothetical protein
MKTPSLIMIFVVTVALLAGCSTPRQSPHQMATNFINRQAVTPTTNESYPAKNPARIALYKSEQKPLTPYRIIGVASVSKHNLIGMERQEGTMHDMIKHLAASIGGDGVIDIRNENDSIKANIIQYQRILI